MLQQQIPEEGMQQPAPINGMGQPIPEEGMQQPRTGPLDRMMPPPMGEAEMAADLEDRFEAVERKKAELDTRKISDTNKLDAMKQEILGKFFQSMQELGVDLDDPASINQFLEELSRKDPDFAILLENAFEILGPQNPEDQPDDLPIGQPMGQPTGQPEKTKEMMDKFGGLQENILRNV